MRTLYFNSLFFCLCFFSTLSAQNWSDNFSDGDFSSGTKIWTGETSLWQVSSGMLRSNGPAATDTIYLSTPSTHALDVQWEFYVRLAFNPSANNFADVYLISDSADVTHVNAQGYYLRIGSTNDDVKLWYRNGVAAPVLLIDGNTASLNFTNNTLKIKVTRSAAGLWSLYTDVTGTGNSYAPEGTATDNSYVSSAWLGVMFRHTSTNSANLYFDDFSVISPIPVDNTPPTVNSVTVTGMNQVDILFSESVDQTTAETFGNYTLAGNTVTTVTRNPANTVRLVFQNNFPPSVVQNLSISGVTDVSGNLMTPASFPFTLAASPVYADVIINEIIGDVSPVVGLPQVEWIELYNRSNKTLNLSNWKISSRTGTGSPTILTLPSFVLQPDTYVVVCTISGKDSFNTSVIQAINPSGFNTNFLTGTGRLIALMDSNSVVLDSVDYLNAWYKNSTKANGGWTLEKINPFDSCIDVIDNWSASMDVSGGTPGRKNSIYSVSANSITPAISGVAITGSQSVQLCFNTKMNVASITNISSYSVSGGLGIQSVQLANSQNTCVDVVFNNVIDPDSIYTLRVNGVQNCYLSAPVNLQDQFQLGGNADYGDIVINEIIGDVTPVVGLPQVEWIELYNRSSKTFNLQNWKITSRTGTGSPTVLTLPAFTLLPDTYVVVCTISGKDSFNTSTIQVIDPSAFNTNFLTSTGRLISLTDSNDFVLDSVNYLSSWYKNSIKANGGWSIEKINPFDTCAMPIDNWAASTDVSGGTPGRKNSIYSVTPNSVTPQLSGINITGPNTVNVCYSVKMDPASITNIGNYSVTGGLTIFQINLSGTDYTCVDITFLNPIQNDSLYTLNIVGVQNCYQAPGVNLQGIFQQGGAPDFKDVIINEIMPDVTPVVGLPEVEFIELHNRSAKTFNLRNWKLSSQSGTSSPVIIDLPTFILLPDTYVVVCTTTGRDSFNTNAIQVINPSAFNSNFLTGTGKLLTLMDSNSVVIDSANYLPSWYKNTGKSNGGWTIEKMNPLDTCASPISNWAASTDPSGGTPGRKNSIYTNTFNPITPVVSSVSVTGPNSVTLCYNVKMDPNSLDATVNYSVSGNLGIQQVSINDAGFTCVDITFLNPFQQDSLYTIYINGIQNCYNSGPYSLQANFIQNSPPQKYEIIINEIFADPAPQVGLPNAEFVEIRNRSDRALNLNGWRLNEGSSTVSLLPAFVLLPDSYLIICPLANVGDFMMYGNVFGMSSFALTNGGEMLTLLDSLGNLIDYVNYSDKWFNDAVKDDGGWTLERIDAQDTCSTQNNWSASQDPTGGTPGRLNSIDGVLTDITGPVLLSVVTLAPDTIMAYFDEPLSLNFAGNISNYSIQNNALTISSVTPQEPDHASLKISFASAMTVGQVYQLDVVNVEDCRGNPVLPGVFGQFILNPVMQRADLIINEVMVDPSPAVNLPGYQFTELYNRSAKYFDVAGMKYNGKVLGSAIMGPGEFLILSNELYTSAFSSYGKTIGVPGIASFTQAGYTLSLTNSNDDVIDEISYTKDWYQDGVKENGGWTLERINPEDTCATFSNWRASIDSSGGTPGKVNSVHNPADDITGPGIVDISVSGLDTVLVYFNESLNGFLSSDETLYTVKELISGNNIPVINAQAIAPDYGLVRLILGAQMTLAASYELSIPQIEDCKGNISALTDTFVVGDIAQPFEVVINEVFTDVSPVVGLPSVKYVEIYNRSTKPFDLTGWSVRKYNASGEFTSTYIFDLPKVILPGKYLVLTPTSGVSAYQSFTQEVLGVGSLSFNISSDRIALVDAEGVVIDRVAYSDTWYRDAVKKNGGYSLERIDPDFICPNTLNWIGSSDATGGTPGKENSAKALFTDNTAPSLLNAYVLGRDTVVLQFDESLDYLSSLDPSGYTISNSVGAPSGIFFPNLGSGDLSVVCLLMPAPLDTNVVYTVSIQGLKDCPGNTISTVIQARVAIPVVPSVKDILINEILFYPYTGRTRFVEIYNNSDKIIDLNKLYLAQIVTGIDSIQNPRQLSTTSMLMFPRTYLCLTPNIQDQLDLYKPVADAAFLQIASIPSYNSTQDEAVLFYGENISGAITPSTPLTRLDQFAYKDSYHFSDLISKRGVSLERINFDGDTQNPDLWHSAASTANYATPGYKNSQQLNPKANGVVSVLPETFSPDGDGIDDILSINYKFNRLGYNGRINIYDATGNLVKILRPNFLLESESGFVTWEGTNENGNKAPVGVYVVVFELVHSASGDREVYKVPCVLAARLN